MRLTSRSKGQTGMTRASAIQFLELPIDQRNFEKKELDKAFRQKARILHPDSPTGNGFKSTIIDYRKIYNSIIGNLFGLELMVLRGQLQSST